MHYFAGQEKQLATHILQLLFIGDTGFRFPVVYYCTTEAVAAELYEMIWNCVNNLKMNDFHVRLTLHYLQ